MIVRRPYRSPDLGPRGRRAPWIGVRDALDGRAVKRAGQGFVRCVVPRVDELARRVLPCGGLVFLDKRAKHLADVHGLTRTTELELAFTPVIPPHPDDQ